MNFVDLFSGAGYLSEGFMQAGFNPIAQGETMTNGVKRVLKRIKC